MTAPCAFRAAVLARHLDGDLSAPVPGVGTGSPEAWRSAADAIADHLEGCASCRLELARARRLDAVLAEHNGRRAARDPAQAERILAAAMARIRPVPGRAGMAGRMRARWSTWRAALSATAALALFAVLVPRWPGAVSDHATGAGADRTDPANVAALDPMPPAPAPAPPPAVAASPFITVASRDRPRRQGDAAATTETEAPAVALPDSVPAWIDALVRLEPSPAGEALLRETRQHPALASALRSRLLAAAVRPDPQDPALQAAITAAARLGGRELDGALRTVCRRGQGLDETLAAALRLPIQRAQRAALLLDLWDDLVARGHASDDDRPGQRLFSDQPFVVPDLVAELRGSRHGPRRVRCLLALAALRAADASDVLLQVLHGPVLPEAVAAAFALGQLPAAALEHLEPAGRPSRDWLLRAALCCAGAPQARDWIDGLDLTPAERELLAAGRFTFAQFPVFAALLRQTPRSTF